MNLPPGPRNFFELMGMLRGRKTNPIKLYEDIFKKFGDVVYFQLGPYKFAMVNDVEVIEQVLQSEARNYTKSTGYQRFALIVGNGLLVSEGDVWKKQRRLLSWAFASKHIERIHPVMVKETIEMIKKWKDLKDLDLAEEMNYVTLQIISVSLFGKNQAMESKGIRHSLQDMLKYLQTTRHLWIQLLLAPFPIKRKSDLALKIESNMPTPGARKFFGSIEAMDKVVHGMIEERKEKKAHENFLDAMIEATDSEDQSQMTSKQLRDEAVNMLIAGHETTANALTWTWHQLLKYPEILKKVQEEIAREISGDSPTFQEVSKLVYTKAVFEESMRLFPPFWRISRKNMTPAKLGKYDIPEGTNVIASIYTIQRKEALWPDPTKFDPERFLQNKNHHRFAFIPFGGGPRACIGQQFATVEALTILSIMIKHCDFEKKFTQDPEYFMSLTLQPKDGCQVKVKRVGL